MLRQAEEASLESIPSGLESLVWFLWSLSLSLGLPEEPWEDYPSHNQRRNYHKNDLPVFAKPTP